MAVLEYVVKDQDGKKITGKYPDSEDAKGLREEMEKLGYNVISIRQRKEKIWKKKGRVSQSEVVTFAYKFSGMFSAGVSVVRCLEMLEEQGGSAYLNYVISDVRKKVEAGLSLRDALDGYDEVFSDFFLGMVEAGETGGKLAETLNMAAVYLDKQAEVKRQIKSAFAYPIIVMIMSVIIVGALIVFVIPVFSKLYQQLKVPLPTPTLFLVALSDMVRSFWWLIFLVVGGLVFLFVKAKSHPAMKSRIDSFKLKMPIFGKLNTMIAVSRFVRTFSLMSMAGVRVLDALDVSDKVTNNTEFSEISEILKDGIMGGYTLSEQMAELDIFPKIIINLATAGEESGALAEMLAKGTDFLDSDIDRTVKGLLLKIEPILTLSLGMMVAFILLAVYLPMFDYMGHIK